MNTLFKPHLIQASLSDYPTVQNLARFYAYDLSRSCGDAPGWEFPADGLYAAHDMKRYFEEEDKFAYLIRVQDELAGFVLINKMGSDKKADWNMGEFYIVAKFQGKGFGQIIAHQIFTQYRGVWDVMAIPENGPARRFWQKTIGEFSQGNYAEQLKTITHDARSFPMIVFRFESKP
jgi:predicted acetyltransferase